LVHILVAQAASGDAKAFEQLVSRFQDAVYATAYQIVFDHEAARDIAQETFVRAYERLGTLRDPAAFPGWILRTCRNLSTDWLRRPERNWVPIEDATVRVEGPAEQVAIRDMVSRALSALPESNRLALSLWLVNGYTYDEVAQLTDAPLSTVKGRIQRGKRQLEREALRMVEDTLKQEAPGEEFTVQAIRKALELAGKLRGQHDRQEAVRVAEDALRKLGEPGPEDTERFALRLEGLRAVAHALFLHDWERWREVYEEILRLADEAGDDWHASAALYQLALQARDIPDDEREAMMDRCLGIWRKLGLRTSVGEALFFRGWHRISNGREEEGWRCLDEARRELAEEPYGYWHACLDASAEVHRELGGRPLGQVAASYAACDASCRHEDGRLVVVSNQGFSRTEGGWRARLTTNGFDIMFHSKWLPVHDPEPGLVEEGTGFTYITRPSTRRVWLEPGGTATVPAGTFENCLLMRATVAEPPEDEGDEQRQRDLTKLFCGEFYCWLARGVGPVEHRGERADGVVEHVVLHEFECPNETTDWVPTSQGTRWVYKPVSPRVDATMTLRVTHVDDDHVFIASHLMAGPYPEDD